MNKEHACGSGPSSKAESSAGACCRGETHKAAGACCKDQPAAAKPAPVTAEYDPKKFLAAIQALDPVTLTMRYRRGIEAVNRRVFELTEEQIDAAFLPEAGVGAWPARVLIGHVADAEVVFVERMRRAVGEDNPVVSVWDENSFVDSGIYGNAPKAYSEEPEGDHHRVMTAVGGPLAVIHTLRQWTGQWLLSLPEAAWSRKIMHPERGEMTLKNILEYATWHLEHHAAFLTRKVDKILGPAPAEEAGACGSGCGCH
jgi:hypothetical protein